MCNFVKAACFIERTMINYIATMFPYSSVTLQKHFVHTEPAEYLQNFLSKLRFIGPVPPKTNDRLAYSDC